MPIGTFKVELPPWPADVNAHGRIAQAREWLYARALAGPGDQVVLLSASSDCQDTVDTLQVMRLAG